MGKFPAPPPPDPVFFVQAAPAILVEGKTSIPRVQRCVSCAAPLKGGICEHCGSEHK